MPRTPRVPCSLGLGSTPCVSEAVSDARGGSLSLRFSLLQYVLWCVSSPYTTYTVANYYQGITKG